MGATSSYRTQTAFRFSNGLLTRLKANARKAKLSLNQYVEGILINNVGLETEYPIIPVDFFNNLSEMEMFSCCRTHETHPGNAQEDQVEKDNELLTEILCEKYA